MKKVFFVFAFVLSSIFSTFANEVKTPINELKKVENVKITISDIPYTITNLDNPKLSEILFDCTVEIDITIWPPDSPRPIRLKGTITVKGKSCMELLKESLE